MVGYGSFCGGRSAILSCFPGFGLHFCASGFCVSIISGGVVFRVR